MHQTILSIITCPKCAKPVKLIEQVFSRGEIIIHGMVACDCAHYPILNGILLMREGKILCKARRCHRWCWPLLRLGCNLPLFVLQLKTGLVMSPIAMWGAFLTGLTRLSEKAYGKLVVVVGLWSRKWSERILRENHHFPDDAFRLVGDWCRQTKRLRLLDVGCGTGSFISRCHSRFEATQFVGVDGDLAGLDMGVRYLNRNLNLVWADLEQRVPFAASSFSHTTMIDTLHYVKNKQRLLLSLRDSMSNPGWMYAARVHNVLCFPNQNSYQHALPLSGYLASFYNNFEVQTSSQPTDAVFYFLAQSKR